MIAGTSRYLAGKTTSTTDSVGKRPELAVELMLAAIVQTLAQRLGSIATPLNKRRFHLVQLAVRSVFRNPYPDRSDSNPYQISKPQNDASYHDA